MNKVPIRWAVLWRSNNRLDGKREYFMGDPQSALLFRTRRDARAHIVERYGYIAKRPDLRKEPHGWKMPIPVRVRVILEPIK